MMSEEYVGSSSIERGGGFVLDVGRKGGCASR